MNKRLLIGAAIIGGALLLLSRQSHAAEVPAATGAGNAPAPDDLVPEPAQPQSLLGSVVDSLMKRGSSGSAADLETSKLAAPATTEPVAKPQSNAHHFTPTALAKLPAIQPTPQPAPVYHPQAAPRPVPHAAEAARQVLATERAPVARVNATHAKRGAPRHARATLR